MKKNSVLIAGASHVWLWDKLKMLRVLPDLSSHELIYGINGLPLFSLEIKEFIETHADQVEHIFLFVSDFRYGNLYLRNNPDFDTIFTDADFDDNYSKRGIFLGPKKELITPQNDKKLYENGLSILDYYQKKYGNKISFIFWDLNIRENQNKLNQKHMSKGSYKHPAWNYDDILNRYHKNTLDVRILRDKIDDYTYDHQGHPSFKGFYFLWHLLHLKDPNQAYEITERQFDTIWKGTFNIDDIPQKIEKLPEHNLSKYRQIIYPLNVYAFLTYFRTGEFRELHYGLFEDSSDDVVIAQKRSTDLLFSHLHKSPATLLEIGIGLGKTHQKLIDKGFDRTGITPDTMQIAIVNEKIKNANLICTRYEDFKLPDKPYDILLFQESAQYIRTTDLFTKADQLLAFDGRILIVDEFSRTGEKLHNIDAFIAAAERSGFSLVEKKELSTQASPTVDYILKGLSDYRDLLRKELDLPTKQLDELSNALQEYKSKYVDGVFAYCLFVFEKKKDNLVSVHGSKMKLDGLGFPDGFDMQKDFEPKETLLIQELIKPGDVIVDIGANIGYYTLLFSRLTGAKGHTYAFEPESRNYALLKKHIKLNHCQNITLVNKGVSSSAQTGKLFINDHNIGMHRAYPSIFNTQRSIDIDLINLDSFFDDRQKIDFIKIDIEGYEYNAFLGMVRVLKQNKKLEIMTEFSPVALWESGTDPVEFIDLITRYGYKIYSIEHQLETVEISSLKKELMKIADTVKSFIHNKTIAADEAAIYILNKMNESGYSRREFENFLLVNPEFFDIDMLKRRFNYAKKRVLILVKVPLENLGGIEIVVQHLIDLLKAYNWEVDIKSNRDVVVNSKVQAFQQYDPYLYDYFALANQLKWKKYDMVITNNFMGGAIYPTEDTKVITLVHGLLTAAICTAPNDILSALQHLYLESIKTAEEMTYRSKKKLISVSGQIQNELEEYFGLPSELINNGFDFKRFNQKDPAIREKYGIPPDKMVGLYAGRWSLAEKRPDITLKLSRLFPDIIWIFATNMPLPESKKFENVLVIQNVPYEEMPSLYAAADFTIQLSLYEGFSNFAMESIASKTPIISTRTGIIDEVYSGTELEELLIEQSFDREVILERAAKKVQLFLDRYQDYRKYSEGLWSDAKEKFSLSKWKTDMAEALGLEK